MAIPTQVTALVTHITVTPTDCRELQIFHCRKRGLTERSSIPKTLSWIIKPNLYTQYRSSHKEINDSKSASEEEREMDQPSGVSDRHQ